MSDHVLYHGDNLDLRRRHVKDETEDLMSPPAKRTNVTFHEDHDRAAAVPEEASPLGTLSLGDTTNGGTVESDDHPALDDEGEQPPPPAGKRPEGKRR